VTAGPVYRFCPQCGGALGPRRLRPGDPARLVCQACAFVFYLDPKVATGVILPLDDGIVLLRRAIQPSYGKWVFPGGYVDRGETPEAAAMREAREEAALDVKIRRLVGLYAYPGNAVILIVYAGEVLGGSLQTDEESLDIRIFPPAGIPWEELAFPSTTQALRDYLGRV
jgi:ADP-ribose pyrophosphatase YjhB (NUDIX family)